MSVASIGGLTGFVVVAGGGTFLLGFLLEVSHRSGRRGLLVGIGIVGSGKGRLSLTVQPYPGQHENQPKVVATIDAESSSSADVPCETALDASHRYA